MLWSEISYYIIVGGVAFEDTVVPEEGIAKPEA